MNIRQMFITKNPSYQKNLKPGDDERYKVFQKRGPVALMLHSVGCPQPSAENFAKRWNRESCDVSVQAVIDGETGEIIQTMPWNFRAWHCAGLGNNTHVGVEMGESRYINYYYLDQFTCSNLPAAQKGARAAYNAAVELFAMLCKEYSINPLTGICSHKEGYYKGIASGHRDPEHYWKGLGLEYTMDGFRADVKSKMEDEVDMTVEQVKNLISAEVQNAEQRIKAEYTQKIQNAATALSKAYSEELTNAIASVTGAAENSITDRLGIQIEHLKDIPSKAVRNNFKPLLDEDFINGGTPKEVDDSDVRLPWAVVRAMTVMKLYTDAKLRALMTDEAPDETGGECDVGDLESCCPIVFPEDETAAGEC